MSTSKPNSAFFKPLTPDSKLAAVVGSEPLPRTQITSKIWDYIRKNGLQDAKNKRQINADETLKALFDGQASVTMFELPKFISKHITA